MADQTPEDVAVRVRRLMRAADRAALATHLTGGGWPYASLVLCASDFDGSPLLLLSDIAEHGKNLAADARASLLIDGTHGLANPLTGLRATAVGRMLHCNSAALLARYVRRHPDAAVYAGFRDFRLYRMTVERVHAVAGFGAIHWLAAGDVLCDTGAAGSLIAAEADILSHMNGDHAEAVALCAEKLLRQSGSIWRMTGIDPEGIDLRSDVAIARLDFEHPIATPEDARKVLASLARRARQRD
jgi:putative heme iron utilization protein